MLRTNLGSKFFFHSSLRSFERSSLRNSLLTDLGRVSCQNWTKFKLSSGVIADIIELFAHGNSGYPTLPTVGARRQFLYVPEMKPSGNSEIQMQHIQRRICRQFTQTATTEQKFTTYNNTSENKESH